VHVTETKFASHNTHIHNKMLENVSKFKVLATTKMKELGLLRK
jgi:hypothetical protein